jgi:hypothetical protein
MTMQQLEGTPARRGPDWGELGPAMRALSERHRDFVRAYVMNPNPNVGGGKAAAYRAAGMGLNSSKEQQAKYGWDLCQEDRIQAAIAEEAKRLVRAGAPGAANILFDVLYDEKSSAADKLRAAGMVLARTDPEIQRADLGVTVKIISRDQEELEEYRAAIEIGATPEKLRELFGGNRLPQIERLDAEDRAQKARVVGAQVIEVKPIEEARPPPAKPAKRAAPVEPPPAEPSPSIDADMLEDL